MRVEGFKKHVIKAADYVRPTMKNNQQVAETVAKILSDIKAEGDVAVDRWTAQIEGRKAGYIELKPFDQYDLGDDLKASIQFAYQRIKNFCLFQVKNLNNDEFSDDIGEFGYIYQPIERIGAYIPGGQFPLISTALMTLTPAQVAGCPVRVACSPSDHPALLAAASLAGATEFLHLGGAQAIGALSFGYQKTAPVSLVVGPGNAYVNQAKAQIQGRTAIDTLAGPSELLIYANQVRNPEWLMLDALAQAEHDANAVSVVVSESEQLLENLYVALVNHDDGKQLLAGDNVVLVRSQNQAESVAFINDFAPEHLTVCDEGFDCSQLTNYGSLFIGENAAVAFGDYCAGPNHTLPTEGAAKYSGGLSVHQFLKVQSTQRISDSGRSKLAKHAAALAEAEGLIYHQKSAEVRSE